MGGLDKIGCKSYFFICRNLINFLKTKNTSLIFKKTMVWLFYIQVGRIMMRFIFKVKKFVNTILSMKKIERLRPFCVFLCPNMSMDVVLFCQGS